MSGFCRFEDNNQFCLKMGNSGGITARNFREGFRSEYIANYIFTAFGTAVQVTQGNDMGIDLLCNLAEFVGTSIIFRSSYGVQIKSEGTEFAYSGTVATKWLSKLEYPLLLAEVSKRDAWIKIYSTWNINRFLLGLHSDNEAHFPEKIKFVTSNDDDKLKEPTSDGIIPVGKPILHFNFYEMDNEEQRDNYRTILSEWLDFDNRNYMFRRAGVSFATGYTKWATNKSVKEIGGDREFYTPYYYSAFHKGKNKTVLANAFIPIALFCKGYYMESNDEIYKREFNAIREYSNTYLFEELDEFGKHLFKDEL